jgi:MFS family permease
MAAEPAPSPLKVVAAVLGVALGGTAVAVGLFLWVLKVMREHHLGIAWVVAAAFVYGVAILGIALGAARLGQRISRAKPSPAARRYQRRFMIAMGAYVFALLGAIGVFLGAHPPPWLAWPLALAPAAPIVGAIVVMGLYLREETDELERAIAGESALWATGALLAIATIWGFLEEFGLVIHVVSWTVFPVWAVCLGIANAIVRRRYQ